MTAFRPAAVVALAAALTVALPARAQPAAPDDPAFDRHVDRAESLYREARYDEAIAEFRAAYAIASEVWLLFNIAQAHRLDGDLDQALAQYRRFVELAPDHPLAGEAALNIEQLRVRIDRRDPLPSRREPAPARTSSTVTVRAPGTGANPVLLWTGGAAIAIGVTALGVGVYHGVEARSASDALSGHDEGAWTDELLARQRTGERAESRMIVFTAIGGAAAATGGLLLYLAWRRNGAAAGDRSTITMAPAIAADGVAFRLGARF